MDSELLSQSFSKQASSFLSITPQFTTNAKIQKTNAILNDIMRKINSSVPKQRSEETILSKEKYLNNRKLMNSTAYPMNFDRHHKSLEHKYAAPNVKVKAYLSNENFCSEVKRGIVRIPTHLLFTKSK